jgi:hypothetical protein
MKNEVIIQTPDPAFWEQYAVLWNNSAEKSPFQAPGILQFFSASCNSEVIAIQLLNDHKLTGAVLLKKDNGIYIFLSDLKTDVNFFVFHQDCTEENIRFFFCSFLYYINKYGWAVILNNVPYWAHYMPILESCGSKSNVFWQNLNYSVSPAIVADTPEQLIKMVDRNRKHRYYFNRLSKQLNAEFEVLENNEDMEGWVREFCNAHIKRWENTVTPSYFKNKGYQQFLLGCLKAWQKDNVLIR